MYESNDINRYLAKTYGDGTLPLSVSMGPVTMLSEGMASAVRVGSGRKARPSREPVKPLELWSYEASPYSRLVREVLTSLELRYVLHNVAKGSARREAFVARSGKMMVPYLADPNTGTELFESADIIRYLEETYGR
jgi:glutathione S-transferase